MSQQPENNISVTRAMAAAIANEEAKQTQNEDVLRALVNENENLRQYVAELEDAYQRVAQFAVEKITESVNLKITALDLAIKQAAAGDSYSNVLEVADNYVVWLKNGLQDDFGDDLTASAPARQGQEGSPPEGASSAPQEG